ncbi:DUF4377 domain-containing protein [Nocardia sp. NPDC052566]|uniref:DUF4377 domain-containing protein n=1 Tax=Nocardia sp. NPDC052566 TaxID=3364330 RepID=UPI0037C72746
MQLRRGRAVLACLLLAPALAACGSGKPAESAAPSSTSAAHSKVIGLWVADQTKPCTGVAPMTCLQVKRNPDSEWELFYNQIAGFEYQPGYHYQLEVEETPVANPPADASSVSYRLIKIVNKVPV